MPLDSVLALRLETKRVAKPKAANPRRKAKQPNAYTIILATPERDYDLFTATSTRAKSNISALERLLGVSAELRNVAPVESDPATLLYPR